jgi:hypothetical protein
MMKVNESMTKQISLSLSIAQTSLARNRSVLSPCCHRPCFCKARWDGGLTIGIFFSRGLIALSIWSKSIKEVINRKKKELAWFNVLFVSNP